MRFSRNFSNLAEGLRNAVSLGLQGLYTSELQPHPGDNFPVHNISISMSPKIIGEL
ncbi:18991_t:CDS:2 [Dentiscutata erythropus]|uniref:18991_t:CDS:1 n=1 Tax=Dentiscutata erythropus TaxID=1348616 RepID=A0A9N9AJ12_9GLOM|nr:18991_t:CDS:2 [Dentiscutata erythropus]